MKFIKIDFELSIIVNKNLSTIYKVCIDPRVEYQIK